MNVTLREADLLKAFGAISPPFSNGPETLQKVQQNKFLIFGYRIYKIISRKGKNVMNNLYFTCGLFAKTKTEEFQNTKTTYFPTHDYAHTVYSIE